MYKIAQSSLENIKSVFGSNTINHSRYEVIDKRIHPLIENFEFAKPFILENSGTVHWKSKLNLNFKCYAEVKDRGLREQIDKAIYNAIQYLEKSLPEGLDTDFLNNIIELPSHNGVYYYIDSDYNIRIVLTEWGFIKDELDFDKGVLRKIKPASLNSGIVLFQDKNGDPVESVSCTVDSPSFQSTLQSDHLGVLKLNGINRREQINISSADSRFASQELIFNNDDEAIVVLKLDLILNVKVVDSDNNPVPSFKLNFKSGNKQIEFKTDLLGKYRIDHPSSEGNFSLFDENQEYITERLPDGRKDYLIRLDREIKNSGVPSSTLEEHPVIFEFLKRRKKPIENQVIELFGVSGKTSLKTNSLGQVEVARSIIATENTLFAKFKKSDWKKDFTYKGEEKLTFIIKGRRFLWWWIPTFLLFFFLFSLIPFEVNHHYTTFDAETNERLSNVNINTSNYSHSQFSVSGTSTNVTDSKGELTIKYGRQSLFNQFFNPIETEILAEKSGYNPLNALVPLAFNNSKKSWLFLNKIPDPLVVIVQPPAQEEVVIPCGGGENDHQSGVQEKNFDLGKANVEFLFEYYNDNQLDIIIVSAENGKELFRVEHATRTGSFEDSILLTSPTQIINVKVIGETIWGIRVNCPN